MLSDMILGLMSMQYNITCSVISDQLMLTHVHPA